MKIGNLLLGGTLSAEGLTGGELLYYDGVEGVIVVLDKGTTSQILKGGDAPSWGTTTGWTGTFINGDGATVTVENGLITGVV